MTVRAVLELSSWDESEAAAMGQQRKLKVFAEDLSRNVDRQSQPIERFHKSSPTSASERIKEPAFACQVAEPPWIAVVFGRSFGRRYNDDLFHSESNASQSGRDGMGIRQEADSAIKSSAPYIFDEVGGPV